MEIDNSSSEEDEMEDVETVSTIVGVVNHVCSLIEDFPSTRDALHFRERRTFADVTGPLKECEFRSAFRMNRTNFRILVDLVRNSLVRNESMGALRNGAIEPEVRVAIVLRITAGASDLDLMVLWGVSRPTIYYIYHDTVAVLLKALPFVEFPHTEERCRELSQQFSTSRRVLNPLPGCIGALDGIAISITKPTLKECVNPISYYHRKGFYAVPVQDICDSKYRFTFFSAKCAGSTHDSVAFSVSSYAERLANGDLPKGYWIAADEAYTCSDTIVTPFGARGRTIRPSEDGFNYFQSSHRIHIEQAFGTMIARWGILWRPLRYSLKHNIRVVELAMCLHNFCVNNADYSAEDLHTEETYATIQEYAAQLLSNRSSASQPASGQDRRTTGTNSETRRALLKIVEDNNIRRPRTR